MRESPSSEVSLHGGLVKAADPHLDPHEETSGRKQWKHGCERVFQSQRKRSKTSGKRYFQNFSTLCNQQVGGSNPSTSSILPQHSILNMGEFPSGQRGQTVNLLSMTSVVRIHLPPPKQSQTNREVAWLCSYLCNLYGRRSLRFGLSARRGRIKKRLLHRIVPAR